MTRFSERIGIVQAKSLVQLDGMSPELRNSLWNLIYRLYEDRYWTRVVRYIAEFFRKVPVDELRDNDYDSRMWLKDFFFGLEWYGVYDLIEFIVNNHVIMTREGSSSYTYVYHNIRPDRIIEVVNQILEGELSGFRFISGTLAPISDKSEVLEVQEAASRSHAVGLSGTAHHIHTAIELLSKKPTPDYRNAVKEAISSVESAVKLLSGVASSGLDSALEELSYTIELHGALKSAFKKLYGYTST